MTIEHQRPHVFDHICLECAREDIWKNPELSAEELTQLRYLWWRISGYFDPKQINGFSVGHDGFKGCIETHEFYQNRKKD